MATYPRLAYHVEDSPMWIIETREGFGHIANEETGRLSPEQPLASLIKVGYWSDAEPDPALLKRLLRLPVQKLPAREE